MKRFLSLVLVAFLPSAAAFADEGDPSEGAVAEAQAPAALPPAVAPPVAPSAPAQSKLVGVVLSTAQALVWDGDRGEYALKRLGETVDGARIVSLQSDRLIVERDGARAELLLDAAPLRAPARRPKRMPAVIVGTLSPSVDAQSTVATQSTVDLLPPAVAQTQNTPPAQAPPAIMIPAAPARRAAVAPATRTTPPPRQDDEVEATVIPRLDLDRELGDWRSLSAQAQVAPAPSGGFSLAAVRPGSFISRVGLRAGDVIVRVDGRPINRVEDAAAAYAWLRVTDRFFVDVLRDGQPLRLHYVIAPATSTAAR